MTEENTLWIIETEESAYLPQEAENAFKQALNGFAGETLIPICCVGQQVVAGLNYLFLCRSKPRTEDQPDSLKMAVVYRSFSAPPQITRVKAFNLEALEKANITLAAEQRMLTGGWSSNPDYRPIELPSKIQAAFDEAAAQLNECCKPLALLAHRELHEGSDDAILCCGERAERLIYRVLFIHWNGQGQGTLKSISDLDLRAFNRD